MITKQEAYMEVIRWVRAANTVAEITCPGEYGQPTRDALASARDAGLTFEEIYIAGKIGVVLGRADRKPELLRSRIKTV
jgi:hypothetical protein